MKRHKFITRKFRLSQASVVDALMRLLPQLPIDSETSLEVTIAEEEKPRKPDQNALMWVNQLADISAQAFLNGRQFSKDTWHHYFKLEFLPEEYDPELCLKGYVKWDYAPNGDRVLVGSTTKLTVKGFAQYLTQVEAFGSELGVMFGVKA